MDEIIAIPNEILRLIPLYGGDKRQLNLFLRKSEYVISKYRGSEVQNLYVYHAVTSRLTDNAAALLSEREDVLSWSELRTLLEQHFGDPRSEQCISLELEGLKLKSGETYLDFCNRIQSVRSLLISKVNLISDASMKTAKITIYNDISLKVFLYNLPEEMVRIVRLRSPNTLEDALKIVLEEVNFHEQYKIRNKISANTNTNTKPIFTAENQGFKFGHFTPNKNLNPGFSQKFNFGIPQTSNKFQSTPQQLGYRPPFNKFQSAPQQFGFRPNVTNQQFGYKPILPQQQFGYRPNMLPQQFGYKPNFSNQQFGYRPNFNSQQFGYRPPQIQDPRHQTTDISMRTVPPRIPNQLKLNELDISELHDPDNMFPTGDEYYNENFVDYDEQYCYEIEPENSENTTSENFHTEASTTDLKS